MKVVPLLEDSIVLDVLSSFFAGCVQETLDTSSLILESQKFVGVYSTWADEATISFGHTNQNGTIICEKLSGPVTDITVTLDDELLSFQTFLKA